MFHRKDYQSKSAKRTDFIIGFAGFFVVNAIMAIIIAVIVGLLDSASVDVSIVETASVILFCLPLLLNLAALLYFAYTRSWLSFGILSALGAMFVLVIVAGIFFTVACFALLASY
jgi:hypothetical protein